MRIVNNNRLLEPCVLLFLAGFCLAADTQKGLLVSDAGFEDLSACKMPHGITELPRKGSNEAIRKAKGYIFNFKEKTLAFDPFTLQKRKPESFQQFRRAIVKEKSGDLYYDYAENQLFFFSSDDRIEDLGEGLLYEFSGKKLSKPKAPSYTEEGETFKGILAGAQAGHCYLMTTLDNEWVLFRIISVDKGLKSCRIQWVRRPKGTKVFTIPKSNVTESKEPLQQKSVLGRDDLLKRDKESKKYLPLLKEASDFVSKTEKYLVERTTLIQSCIEILRTPERAEAVEYEKNALFGKKISALRTLGKLRAAEAAPLLASMIDARISNSTFTYENTLESTYGCFWALCQIGKPGVAACIEEIKKLKPAERGAIKENLLSFVLVSVEGKKVAELLLSEEMKKAGSDKEKIKNIERALLLITKVTGNWGYKIEEEGVKKN